MARAGLQPLHRVLFMNSAADLQSSRVSCQRFPRRRVISRSQLDHMSARQAVRRGKSPQTIPPAGPRRNSPSVPRRRRAGCRRRFVSPGPGGGRCKGGIESWKSQLRGFFPPPHGSQAGSGCLKIGRADPAWSARMGGEDGKRKRCAEPRTARQPFTLKGGQGSPRPPGVLPERTNSRSRTHRAETSRSSGYPPRS